MNQWDKEEDYLCEAYNDGEITLKEYNFEMNELRRAYREYAEECAQNTYDDVMNGSW